MSVLKNSLLTSTVKDWDAGYSRSSQSGLDALAPVDTSDHSWSMVQTGLSNYSATNVLNIVTGGGNPNSFGIGSWGTAGAVGTASPLILPSVYLALMTAVDQDTGTGGIEVSGTTGGGTGYVRVQVAGTQLTSATSGTATNTLTVSGVPSWIQNGMFVQNVKAAGTQSSGTASIALGTTVTGTAATTITLSGSMTGSVGTGDFIQFTAFNLATQSGTAPEPPGQINNNSIITFPQATGGTAPGFGIVMAFELRDGSLGGNLLLWDFLGNFQWYPATVASGSGATITAHAHGYSAGQAIIWTNEYGGTIPSFTTSTFTTSGSAVLTVSGTGGSPTTDTFFVLNGGTSVVTSSTGNGMVRAVTQQSIPAGVTASFAVGALVATAA
jgi:hypothetical protein